MKVDKNHVHNMLVQLRGLQKRINPEHRQIDGGHIVYHLEAEKLQRDILGSFGLPDTEEYQKHLYDLKSWNLEVIIEDLEEDGQCFLLSPPRGIKELLIGYKKGDVQLDEVLSEGSIRRNKYMLYLLEEIWLQDRVDIDILSEELKLDEQKRGLLKSSPSELRLLFEDEVEQNPFEQYG